MSEHREVTIDALRFYIQWMDALFNTAADRAGAAEHAVEKYKAEQALAELEARP